MVCGAGAGAQVPQAGKRRGRGGGRAQSTAVRLLSHISAVTAGSQAIAQG